MLVESAFGLQLRSEGGKKIITLPTFHGGARIDIANRDALQPSRGSSWTRKCLLALRIGLNASTAA
jgi:hypothetical protein